MRIVNNNIESLPIDVILVLLQLLLAGGFENAFNFFIAWARTQRPSVIYSLLKEFPLRLVYKFGALGSDGDKASFDRFFLIAERLGIPDAILYRRCTDILRGVGNIDLHLTTLNGLGRNGHFKICLVD